MWCNEIICTTIRSNFTEDMISNIQYCAEYWAAERSIKYASWEYFSKKGCVNIAGQNCARLICSVNNKHKCQPQVTFKSLLFLYFVLCNNFCLHVGAWNWVISCVLIHFKVYTKWTLTFVKTSVYFNSEKKSGQFNAYLGILYYKSYSFESAK